jgi:DNA-binding transcriptional regulator YbjK
MKRKPNAEERRRDLCDAAIELLAEDGARGLTHLRVDRRAGVADGTTSFYFQTRSALLRGATDRKVQLDVADFTAAMNEAKAAQGEGRIVPRKREVPPAVAIGRAGDAYRRRTRTVACTCPVRGADGRRPRS